MGLQDEEAIIVFKCSAANGVQGLLLVGLEDLMGCWRQIRGSVLIPTPMDWDTLCNSIDFTHNGHKNVPLHSYNI